MQIKFILNGEDVEASAQPLEKLSDILRDKFGIDSLMNDCRTGICGKCVVFFNGRLATTCLIPAFKARGSEIITYEGFKSTPNYNIVVKAFKDAGVEFCGFCDSAFYMAVGSLLEHTDRPSDKEIIETISSVYCRCTIPSLTLEAAMMAIEYRMGGKYNRAH